MNGERLVDLLNPIAEFFAAAPDANAAVRDIASHVRRFWDPAMRGDLQTQVAGTPLMERLHPLAKQAVEQLLES